MCSEVLSYCDILKEKICKDDRVILAVGANETNPFLLIKHLNIALHKLQNIKVYVIGVLKSQYIQELKLNEYISSVTKTYTNCKYLQCTNYRLQYYSLLDIAKKINFTIDVEDYENTFLNTNKIKQFINKINDTGKEKLIKGTIPYYFNKQKNKQKVTKNTNNNINIIQLNNSPSQPKKGTIPFYFVTKTKPQTHHFFRRNTNL